MCLAYLKSFLSFSSSPVRTPKLQMAAEQPSKVECPLQVSSVAHLCATLCDPMNCSKPGLPVHHQLPEFTQTHVHRVSDAFQPSHPLSSSCPQSLPASVFSNESTLHNRWPKYWSFSFSIIPSKEYPGLMDVAKSWLVYGVAKSWTRLSNFHSRRFHFSV